MEMCYDGALVMPSNYAVMNEDEMMYVEGGFSAKSLVQTVVAAGLTAFLGYCVKSSLVGTVIGLCASSVINAFNSAVLIATFYPEKATAFVVTTGVLCYVFYDIYKTGRRAGKW